MSIVPLRKVREGGRDERDGRKGKRGIEEERMKMNEETLQAFYNLDFSQEQWIKLGVLR